MNSVPIRYRNSDLKSKHEKKWKLSASLEVVWKYFQAAFTLEYCITTYVENMQPFRNIHSAAAVGDFRMLSELLASGGDVDMPEASPQFGRRCAIIPIIYM